MFSFTPHHSRVNHLTTSTPFHSISGSFLIYTFLLTSLYHNLISKSNILPPLQCALSRNLHVAGGVDAMASSQEAEREQFFSALYRLDDLSDDEVAPMPTAKLTLRPPTANTASEVTPVLRPLALSIAPEVMLQQQSSAPKIIDEAEVPQKPTTQRRRPIPWQPRPTPVSSKSRGKKNAKSKTIPEAHQIFKGSTFYFIPNNDVAAPRKMRIQRALQYGAVWERRWPAEVTHLIVDSILTVPDVLKSLRVDKLPVRTSSFFLT